MYIKYKQVTGYWVYVLITPDGMFYVGQSNQPVNQKWRPRDYMKKPFIKDYKWEEIRKVILIDGLTKEQAYILEDLLILEYIKMGCSINQKRSGGDRWKTGSDECKKYMRLYQKQFGKITHQKYYSKPENRLYDRVSAFNRYHPDRIQETPLEAKQKYLQWGYIPDYIKNDDLH